MLYEVRCPNCHHLLGKFEGKGEVKCKCKGFAIFDTDKRIYRYSRTAETATSKSSEFEKINKRVTSSGARFQ
ncbi:hypothetical protein [Anaerosporobacter sp.]|uniref:hypothetical protein n=1 Tax=Anaerosporobacter sp. TaxID=1872529 RepID=UPI00286F29A3|nr:hypothetical protein [Anaerosporobacter sp.]